MGGEPSRFLPRYCWCRCGKHLPLSLPAHRSFVRELSGESAVRRIPIVMTFLVEDDALTLIVTDGRECAEAHVAMDLDAPSNPERNRETLIRNLGRLG